MQLSPRFDRNRFEYSTVTEALKNCMQLFHPNCTLPYLRWIWTKFAKIFRIYVKWHKWLAYEKSCQMMGYFSFFKTFHVLPSRKTTLELFPDISGPMTKYSWGFIYIFIRHVRISWRSFRCDESLISEIQVKANGVFFRILKLGRTSERRRNDVMFPNSDSRMRIGT